MTLGSVGTCSPPPGGREGTGSDGQEQLGLCSRRSRSIHARVLTPCSLMTWVCRATLVTASSHLLPIMTLRGHTRGALVLTSHRMDPVLEGSQGLTPTYPRGLGTKAITLASGQGSFCPTRPRASPGGLRQKGFVLPRRLSLSLAPAPIQLADRRGARLPFARVTGQKGDKRPCLCALQSPLRV